MKETSFGQRLLEAFGNASHRQIADKIGVSRAAVGNYVAGRVPPMETLLKIKEATECDLDWLLTGDASRLVAGPRLGDPLLKRLDAIAAEQAPILFGEADIVGLNVKERTLDLLVEFLITRSLRRYGILEGEPMSAADRKLAKKFTFVDNVSQSIDDRVLDLIHETRAFDRNEIRAIMQELIQEEAAKSNEAPLFEARFRNTDDEDLEETTRRKTG